MKLEQGKFCPLIGKDCIGLQCSWFTQIRGSHPQTGELIDEWGCAVVWMPTLLIENSQQQRQTGAAVENFRNIATEQNQQLQENLLEAQKIVPAIVSAALNNKTAIEGSK